MGETKEPAVAKLGQTELSDTQRMMYAFGDSRRPKAETAKVLETVVLSQITGVVTQVVHLSTGFSKAKILVQCLTLPCPGCKGGRLQGLKEPWSGGLALPHEAQSCQGKTPNNELDFVGNDETYQTVIPLCQVQRLVKYLTAHEVSTTSRSHASSGFLFCETKHN